jgi:Common central domain of tyrosinase
MAFGDGVRRNIATVPREERDALRDAFIGLNRRFYPGNRGDRPLPGGISFWFKQDEIHAATHVHHGPAFLTWHRELCNRFEALLREVDPRVSLHYWDWSTDPRKSPDGRGGFVNLFSSDFMGSGSGDAGEPWLGAGFYDPKAAPSRDGSGGTAADPPAELKRRVHSGRPNTGTDAWPSDDAIVSAEEYPAMRLLLESAHDSAHGYIGGTIGNAHTSFRDPFVYVLHSNVDRVFARWQLQPGKEWRLDPAKVFGSESTSVASARQEVGILNLLAPWAGWEGARFAPGEHAVRPWAPPENEQDRIDNQKDSMDPSIVFPPLYEGMRPRSLRELFSLRGNDPRAGMRSLEPAASSVSLRDLLAR